MKALDLKALASWGLISGLLFFSAVMAGDTIFKDSFVELPQYVVQPSAGPNGTISPNVPVLIKEGRVAEFLLNPDEGYKAKEPTGTCGGVLEASTFTTLPIVEDCNVHFEFEVILTHTITAMAGTGGSIDPTERTVEHGSTTTFTVTPDQGYSIATVTGCGGSLEGQTYTTGEITADCLVEASFEDFALLWVEPAGGSSSVGVNVNIVLTFNQAVDPTTVVGQTGFGSCSGTVQFSNDDFNTCQPFAAASASMSEGDTVATLTPAPGLSFGTNYQIRINTDVQSAGGEPLPYPFSVSWTTELDARCDLVDTECAINESGLDDEADFCNLQFPGSITTTTGSSTMVYGRIYEAMQTGGGAVNPIIQAQLGVGPGNRNPQHESGWSWIDADYNVSVGNDDEYQAALIAPDPGEYHYGFRFSFDGYRWTYCDLNGAGSNPSLGFQLGLLGQLTVTGAE